MPLDILVFLSSPDLADNFKTLKKDDLLLLADHFQIQIRPNMKKAEIKTLIEKKLMEEGKVALADSLVMAAVWTHYTNVNKLGYMPLQLLT